MCGAVRWLFFLVILLLYGTVLGVLDVAVVLGVVIALSIYLYMRVRGAAF